MPHMARTPDSQTPHRSATHTCEPRLGQAPWPLATLELRELVRKLERRWRAARAARTAHVAPLAPLAPLPLAEVRALCDTLHLLW